VPVGPVHHWRHVQAAIDTMGNFVHACYSELKSGKRQKRLPVKT
jgi:hypothetical protein